MLRNLNDTMIKESMLESMLESPEESMLESPKSFNKVVARKWAERGMRAMSMAALSAQITAIKKDERKLGALDRERISRKVKDRVAVTLSVTSVSAESAVEVTPI